MRTKNDQLKIDLACLRKLLFSSSQIYKNLMQRNTQLTETLKQLHQGSFGLTIRILVFRLSHNLDYIFVYRQSLQGYLFHSRLGGSSCFLPGLDLTDRYFPNTKLSALLWFSTFGSPYSLIFFLFDYLTCWWDQSYSMVQPWVFISASSVRALFP